MTKKRKKPLKSAKPRQDNSFRQEVSLTCACNRDITLAELGRTYTAQGKAKLELFLPYLNATFKKYDISSCLRKAHFLAQVGHESGQLHFTAEAGISADIERKRYKGYKGRGLIQITFKDMYEKYGNAVGHSFLENQKVDLEQTNWATDSAGWFWKFGKSIDFNDYADKNDLIYVSQKINGAFNGYDDRKSLLERAYKALLVNDCQNSQIRWDFSDFKLTDSAAYNEAAPAFAWGLWHDSTSSKKGVKKDDSQALIGYSRFIDLEKSHPHHQRFKKGKKPQQKVEDGRFGMKYWTDMITHAETRVNALPKKKDE